MAKYARANKVFAILALLVILFMILALVVTSLPPAAP